MITDYLVCNGSDSESLRKSVNEAIREGWQPHGGVAVSVTWDRLHTAANWELFQAVVKVAKDRS
jgi:hypothetical protein